MRSGEETCQLRHGDDPHVRPPGRLAGYPTRLDSVRPPPVMETGKQDKTGYRSVSGRDSRINAPSSRTEDGAPQARPETTASPFLGVPLSNANRLSGRVGISWAEGHDGVGVLWGLRPLRVSSVKCRRVQNEAATTTRKAWPKTWGRFQETIVATPLYSKVRPGFLPSLDSQAARDRLYGVQSAVEVVPDSQSSARSWGATMVACPSSSDDDD